MAKDAAAIATGFREEAQRLQRDANALQRRANDMLAVALICEGRWAPTGATEEERLDRLAPEVRARLLGKAERRRGRGRESADAPTVAS